MDMLSALLGLDFERASAADALHIPPRRLGLPPARPTEESRLSTARGTRLAMDGVARHDGLEGEAHYRIRPEPGGVEVLGVARLSGDEPPERIHLPSVEFEEGPLLFVFARRAVTEVRRISPDGGIGVLRRSPFGSALPRQRVEYQAVSFRRAELRSQDVPYRREGFRREVVLNDGDCFRFARGGGALSPILAFVGDFSSKVLSCGIDCSLECASVGWKEIGS
mmetsp:Transcript_14133/g.41470  ORF Transcript_14133/g.41470 Transcript_14133/m.41470 type:complete len:223 (+) Transcript_14133:547-1215(+)